MKKIKIAVLIFTVIAATVSCDKRKDYFEEFNQAPNFTIRRQGLGGSFVTTLFDSVWIGQSVSYVGDFRTLGEPKDNYTYSFNTVVGSGNLVYDEPNKSFSVTNIGGNKNNFELISTDKYGLSSTCYLELYRVNNRTPHALLSITQTNASSPREININGGLSTDIDTPFGDRINEYQFKVGSTYTVNTPYNNINFIAPTTGTVWISLKVKDTQGALSIRDSVLFNVQ
jgi:hypothetical protein